MIDSRSGYITQEDLFRKVNASESQQLLFKDFAIKGTHSVSDFSSLYNAHSPGWIFAFLKTLDAASENSAQNLEMAMSMTDLYIRLEEWIIETPHFLASFPEIEQAAITDKAVRLLFQANTRQEALRLIISGEADRYVGDILCKIESSGASLFERDRKLLVVFAIFLLKPDIQDLPTTGFLRLFKFISEEEIPCFDPVFLIGTIEKRLIREAAKLDKILLSGQITPEIRQKAENMIRLAGAEFLAAKRGGKGLNVLRRLMFYRYLCIIDERHPQALKNLAFNTLTTMTSRPPEFTWGEVIDFSLARFTDKISYFAAASIDHDNVKRHFEGVGMITLSDKIFTISAYGSASTGNRLSGFVSCLDGAVLIRTTYKPKMDLNTCPDLSVLSRHWEFALEEFKDKQKKWININKERPPVGTLLKIRVKNLTPSLPLLAFVHIEDEHYKGDGVLHSSEVSWVKLLTLEDIFSPGDLMSARVIESTDKKLAFSIREEVSLSIGARFHAGEYTRAKLLTKKEKLLIWVSEEGYPLYTLPSSDYDPEVNDIHTLQLNEVNYNGYIKAEIEEPLTDVEIDTHHAVGQLINSFLDSVPDSRKECLEQLNKLEDERPFSDEHIRQLEYILDLYTNSSTNYIYKFNLLYVARVVARFCGNTAAEKFYKYRILYMLELYRFTNQKSFDAKIITDDIVREFSRLSKAQMILSLLSAVADDSRIEELQTYSTSEQKQVATLARLLLVRHYASNAYPVITKEVDTEILALLAFGVDEPDDDRKADEVNFGRENNNREFKSTIVFPPESHCAADLDQQMNSILATICGFLNAEGGTLYVGVNDSGFPQGIENDLHYLHCNEDKYQLLIRRYIVRYLNKDINGLIVIGFRSYNGKTVCAIAVPAYHHIVSFKDTVWQRQGNSTRSLEGETLKFLKERKKTAGMSHQARPPEFPGDLPVAEKIPLAVTPMVIPEELPEEKMVNTISTSALNFALNDGLKAIAFFTILDSGKFVVTENDPYRDDARITLPIFEDNRSGYLLQVYANGYVNRVAVVTILSKKRNYEYINALFANAVIVFVAFANKNDFIYLKTLFKGEEYIKMQSLKWIKMNTDLSLKGTPLFSVPFERLAAVEVLNPQQAKDLEHIQNEVITTLGSPVSSLSVIKEVVYLKNLGCF